ncbi:hypothetical protein BTUL_0067g00060 [Botrytis tulipae]|uniref:Uncharacterized protein n=1 Tax=Botrytis tulipae TaxID=87230 RepID=A0A4Z1EME1_9HELO|nr:hypothetical protein BTUL_0067g00060 [Botrytis tulipae]
MLTIYLAANFKSEGQYGLALFCKGCTRIMRHDSDLEVRGAKCDDENHDRSLTLRLLAVDLLQFESSLIDSASITSILCKSAECLLFESSLQDTSP